MLKFIKNFGKPSHSKTADLSPTEVATKVSRAELMNIPRYPPFDQGIVVDDIDLIIESQSELLDRIQMSFGMTEHDYQDLVVRVIRNYAAYIHLLPATRNEHHRGAGGLFRLGLEIGFYALQSSSGVVFSNRDSAERRRMLQPKWSYATFLAGLCCELYRPITSLIVVDETGSEWPQLMEPLYDWAMARNAERYFIRWNEPTNGYDMMQRHANAAYLLNAIIPQDCLQYMNADGAQIITAMTATITGAARPNTGNTIYDLVSRAQEQVITVDLKKNPEFYGKLTVGAHMEPHIIDAMRRLVKAKKWQSNVKHARIWAGKEGYFVVWGAGFKELSEAMAEANLPGVPQNEDTMAEIMLNSGILHPNPHGGPYWDIFIPGTAKLCKAVRIAHPSAIFGDDLADPLDKSLLSCDDAAVQTKPADPPPQNPQDKPIVKEGQTPSTAAPEKTKSAGSVNPDAQRTEPVKSAEPRESKPTLQQPQQDAKVNENGRGNLFDTLHADSQRLLGAILDDFKNSESEHPVWWCDAGLAISTDEFGSHGISELVVLRELGASRGGKGWLVMENGSSKQFMTLKFRGKETKAYVLNEAVATSLGFPKQRKG